MKFTEINEKTQKRLKDIVKKYPPVASIIKDIDMARGRALLVGGAVRDLMLNQPVKDVDIEVHDLSLNDLERILKKYGLVSLVGKVYGVLRLHGLDVDWSVPRTDTAGRKPKVIIDPHMGFKDAFARRDLTINAMGIDLKTYEIIDPFKGMNDLKKGLLRAPDAKKFVEDPLRFFRVMQFIGRFGMHPDKTLNKLCKSMDLKKVSIERIDEEFRKLLLKSQKPSLAFEWLASIGRLKDVLPELAATVGVKQNPDWHPEGDVFEHTMQTIDAAADMKFENDENKLLIMYAALCHDLGKARTTKKINGKLRSFRHAEVGVKDTKKLLSRITRNKELIHDVCILVKYHMMPGQLVASGAHPGAYKRLARKLAPRTTMQDLASLALADKRGRNPKKGNPLKKNFKDVQEFLKKSEQAHVLQTFEKPILQGRDVMDVVKPGPEMGKLLKKAYEIQIEEGIQDKEKLKKRIIS